MGSSQVMREYQRRVRLMTPLLIRLRPPVKTPPMVFSHFQRSTIDARLSHSPRNLRVSRSTKSLDKRELTLDTTVLESREQRRPRRKRSEQTLLTISRTRNDFGSYML